MLKRSLLVFISIPIITAYLAMATEYRRAVPGYQHAFPGDHYPHYGFRTEWWYYTGHLTQGSKRYGFQFTIFKVETQPTIQKDIYSSDVLYIFHCGITMEAEQRFVHDEVAQRDFPGMAGFNENKKMIYVKNNSLLIEKNRHQLKMKCKDTKLELELHTTNPPLIHGRNGISQKGVEKKNASYYYSIVDLGGKAKLKMPGKSFELDSQVWMDHEFGSNVLAADQHGWDWVNIQLDNGERLMFFQVRSKKGKNYVYGIKIGTKQQRTIIPADRIRFIPRKFWFSNHTKARYPVEWKIVAGDFSYRITAWLSNQELITKVAGVSYWEGAVDVEMKRENKVVKGVGYLEMTGYVSSMKNKI